MKSRQRLREAAFSFKDASILVVGDIMLDQFVWGEVKRISPEAPVPVVEVEKESFLLGGAANVSNNLRALGARAVLAGIVGKDEYGRVLIDKCHQRGIDTEGTVMTNERPTTLKTRIIARSQQVVRVDREDSSPVSETITNSLLDRLEKVLENVQAVIVSDYNKGVISQKVMDFLISRATEKGKHVVVDPKPVNATLYKGAFAITPNTKEAEEMSNLDTSTQKGLEQCAKQMANELELEAVLITRGAEGMTLWQKERGIFSIPTMAREVFDVTGAGDTVISLFTLGLVAGLSLCQAAYMANVAAGIVVGKVGTATVSLEELLKALERAPEVDFSKIS